MKSGVEPAGEETVEAAAPAEKRVEFASRGLVLGAAGALLLMWLFLRLADEVMESATLRFDAAIVRAQLDHSNPAMHRFMDTVSFLANGNCQTILVLAVTALLLARGRFWPDGVTLLVAGFGGMFLDDGLKQIFHRMRPEPMFYQLGYSFPSGHSFSSVAIYGLLAYWIGQEVGSRWRILVWAVAVALILLVGFSRVYLAQHYPTDVIGGYLAGSCWLSGCIIWLTILRNRRPRDAQIDGSGAAPSV